MAHVYPWSISIKQAREKLFWSQRDLAEKIGAEERSVRSWELGENIPSPYSRGKLCEVFGKTPEELSLDPDTVRKISAMLKSSIPEDDVVNEQPEQIIEGSITIIGTTLSSIEPNQPDVLQSTTPQNRFGAPYPSIWNIPRRHKASFVGRDTIFTQIYKGFSPDQTETLLPQALNGLGGVGKTQMAVEYAYRHRNNYQAVLWVNAATTEGLLANYLALGDLLKLPDIHSQTEDERIQLIKQWFTTHDQWLLIFDNVDYDNANLQNINYDDSNHIARLDPWLPKTAPGHILFTTRAQAVGDLAQHILVEPLEPQDGALCVLRRAQIIRWNEQLNSTTTKRVEAAEKLSQLTGGLALALEQAGAYIDDTGCGVVRYLELYEQEVYRSQLHKIRSGFVPDYLLAVASTWKVSCQAIQANPAATIILTLCTFLSSDAIPEELFTKGAPALAEEIVTQNTPVPGLHPGKNTISPIDFNAALRSLRQYSLLKYDVDQDADIPRLSIHRLLQEIQIADMDEETQQFWAGCAVQVVAHTLPYVEWQILRPHVNMCLQHIERWQIRSQEADILRQAAEQ